MQELRWLAWPSAITEAREYRERFLRNYRIIQLFFLLRFISRANGLINGIYTDKYLKSYVWQTYHKDGLGDLVEKETQEIVLFFGMTDCLYVDIYRSFT